MKARIVEEPKVFRKIELILEKKEEAGVLWAFIAASNGDIAKFLKGEYPQLTTRNRDELVEATEDMFDKLSKYFTPEWYNDC